MKKNMIALLLSVVMTVGSISGTPALAAETTTEEAVTVEKETADGAEDVTSEAKHVETEETVESSYEGECVEVIEENPSQDSTESVEEAETTEETEVIEDLEEADFTDTANTSEEAAEVEEPVASEKETVQSPKQQLTVTNQATNDDTDTIEKIYMYPGYVHKFRVECKNVSDLALGGTGLKPVEITSSNMNVARVCASIVFMGGKDKIFEFDLGIHAVSAGVSIITVKDSKTGKVYFTRGVVVGYPVNQTYDTCINQVISLPARFCTNDLNEKPVLVFKDPNSSYSSISINRINKDFGVNSELIGYHDIAIYDEVNLTFNKSGIYEFEIHDAFANCIGIYTINVYDHHYESNIIKEATCSTRAVRRFYCTRCYTAYEEEEGSYTDHVWENVYSIDKKPSCTEDGSQSIHCSVCNAIDKTRVRAIAATGHAWGSQYTTDKEPTYTEEGSESIHCSVCNEIKNGSERAIAKKRKPVSMLTISGIIDKTYNDNAQMQDVVVMDGDATLVEGTDYTVSYENNTNAGTASVIITGIGNYTDSVTSDFTIKKAPNTITAKSFTRTYSTKAQTFSLDVKIKNGTPTYKSSTKSVTVSKAGKVTVKAKFIGKATITITAPASKNYTATTKKITITVNPTKTALSSVTSPSAGKMTVKWKKNAVGTGYQIQYSTSSKFMSPKAVSVTKNSTLTKTIGGLAKGKKYYVRIRTYKTVGSTKFYSGWSAAKTVTIKK